MKKTFLAIVTSLLVISMSLTSTGCFGSFNLVKKVYKFNEGIGDKWINEIGFLVMTIVQVYSIAATIDVIILNSIEFWTGSNPVSASMDPVVVPVNGETSVAFQGNTVELRQGDQVYAMEKSDAGTLVKNADGTLLGTCTMTAEGGFRIIDATGKIVASYSASEVQKLQDRFLGAQ
ncbi:MAG: DUF3332 family protein [Bacteroidota bacterium]